MHSFLEPRKLVSTNLLFVFNNIQILFVVHRFTEGSFMLALEVQASFDQATNLKEFTI